MDVTFALRAVGEWIVGEALNPFETNSTRITFILIDRHIQNLLFPLIVLVFYYTPIREKRKRADLRDFEAVRIGL